MATAASISALAVDETHVYWVEYGTHDDLGNHRRDGVLRMSAVGGGTVTTIAEGLPGPNGLGVTSTHAYVFVNAAPLADGTVGEATVRVPLAGGVVEPVLEQGSRRCFACFGAAGDRAIWIGGPGETLWTQTAEDSVPTVLVETGARRLTALANDEAYAYFFTEVRSSTETRQIRRVPLTGGASEDVAAGPPESRAHVLALDGEQLIATTVEHVYGKPLVGGAWTRVLEIPARVSPDRLWLFGPDRVAMRARYPGSAVPVGVFVATIGSNPFEPSVERIDPELRTVRTVPLAVHERFVFWTSDDRSMLLRRAW